MTSKRFKSPYHCVICPLTQPFRWLTNKKDKFKPFCKAAFSFDQTNLKYLSVHFLYISIFFVECLLFRLFSLLFRLFRLCLLGFDQLTEPINWKMQEKQHAPNLQEGETIDICSLWETIDICSLWGTL